MTRVEEGIVVPLELSRELLTCRDQDRQVSQETHREREGEREREREMRGREREKTEGGLQAWAWPCGPTDKASDYESGDSRFESWQGRLFYFSPTLCYNFFLNK